MDFSADRLQHYMGWDARNWGRALPFWHKVLAGNPSGQTGLEIGAGQGGLSLYLALQGYHVVCSDLTNPAARAQPLHKRYKIDDKITYAAIDVTSIPYPDSSFDVIIFKSLLGGVGRNDQKQRQQLALDEIYRALKPGGYLLFAENLTGSFFHRFLRRRFVNWGQSWRYLTVAEMHELLSHFSEVKSETFGFFATLGRSEPQRNVLHYLDVIFAPLTPTSWRYLIYGYARK